MFNLLQCKRERDTKLKIVNASTSAMKMFVFGIDNYDWCSDEASPEAFQGQTIKASEDLTKLLKINSFARGNRIKIFFAPDPAVAPAAVLYPNQSGRPEISWEKYSELHNASGETDEEDERIAREHLFVKFDQAEALGGDAGANAVSDIKKLGDNVSKVLTIAGAAGGAALGVTVAGLVLPTTATAAATAAFTTGTAVTFTLVIREFGMPVANFIAKKLNSGHSGEKVHDRALMHMHKIYDIDYIIEDSDKQIVLRIREKQEASMVFEENPKAAVRRDSVENKSAHYPSADTVLEVDPALRDEEDEDYPIEDISPAAAVAAGAGRDSVENKSAHYPSADTVLEVDPALRDEEDDAPTVPGPPPPLTGKSDENGSAAVPMGSVKSKSAATPSSDEEDEDYPIEDISPAAAVAAGAGRDSVENRGAPRVEGSSSKHSTISSDVIEESLGSVPSSNEEELSVAGEILSEPDIV